MTICNLLFSYNIIHLLVNLNIVKKSLLRYIYFNFEYINYHMLLLDLFLLFRLLGLNHYIRYLLVCILVFSLRYLSLVNLYLLLFVSG